MLHRFSSCRRFPRVSFRQNPLPKHKLLPATRPTKCFNILPVFTVARSYANQPPHNEIEDKDKVIALLKEALKQKELELVSHPIIIQAKEEERKQKQEEERAKSSEQEAKAKHEERIMTEIETRRKVEELKFKIPMAWIGFVLTFLPLLWTLRSESDRYKKMREEQKYEYDRRPANQEQSMIAALSSSNFGNLPPDIVWCDRPEDEELIYNAMFKQLGQIIILEGPNGVGKSTLIKKILRDTAHQHKVWFLHYDLRGEETPATPEDLLYGFLRSVGYVIDPPGTEDFNKNKSKALNHLAKVLEDGVRKGFRPIIVLDNFEAIESLLLQPGGSTKALINKLLEMANQGIANVVVTINLPTSMMYLDSIVIGWRTRRTLYFLSSTGPYEYMENYIKKLNQAEPDPSKRVSPEDTKLLHEKVGLNMADLSLILSTWKATSAPIKDLVKSRIIEEDHRITALLGKVYAGDVVEFDVQSEAKNVGTYLRIWDLMQKLTKNGYVGEKELASMPEKEFDWCLKHNLISIERAGGAYRVVPERQIVLEGMKSYMDSPTVKAHRYKLLMRYTSKKKEELLQQRAALMADTTGGLAVEAQLEVLESQLEDLTKLQLEALSHQGKLRKKYEEARQSLVVNLDTLAENEL